MNDPSQGLTGTVEDEGDGSQGKTLVEEEKCAWDHFMAMKGDVFLREKFTLGLGCLAGDDACGLVFKEEAKGLQGLRSEEEEEEE